MPKAHLASSAGADPDVQLNMLAGSGGESVRMGNQIARNQGEQIGWFWPWIVPFRPTFARARRVAVGQQDRSGRLRSAR